ncbi:MAG: hypothetical protein ACQEP1_00595 [Nanobdellota archaeon]
MKCKICGGRIEENFLKKPMGTHIKDEKGKMHLICRECQQKLENKKEKILENL